MFVDCFSKIRDNARDFFYWWMWFLMSNARNNWNKNEKKNITMIFTKMCLHVISMLMQTRFCCWCHCKRFFVWTHFFFFNSYKIVNVHILTRSNKYKWSVIDVRHADVDVYVDVMSMCDLLVTCYYFPCFIDWVTFESQLQTHRICFRVTKFHFVISTISSNSLNWWQIVYFIDAVIRFMFHVTVTRSQ